MGVMYSHMLTPSQRKNSRLLQECHVCCKTAINTRAIYDMKHQFFVYNYFYGPLYLYPLSIVYHLWTATVNQYTSYGADVFPTVPVYIRVIK